MYKLCINTIKSIFFISFSISLAYFPHICCSFVHIFPISVVNGPIKVCIDDRYEDIYNRMGERMDRLTKYTFFFPFFCQFLSPIMLEEDIKEDVEGVSIFLSSICKFPESVGKRKWETRWQERWNGENMLRIMLKGISRCYKKWRNIRFPHFCCIFSDYFFFLYEIIIQNILFSSIFEDLKKEKAAPPTC